MHPCSREPRPGRTRAGLRPPGAAVPGAWPGRRVFVGGVGLDLVSARQAQDFIRTAVLRQSRPARHVVTVNLDFLAVAHSHPAFRAILNRADLACTDGEAVRWLALAAGQRIPARVPGADLTTWLLGGGISGARFFLLGASPDVLTAVRAQAAARGVLVAGTASPPRAAITSAARSAAMVDQVNQCRPDILLVAFGAPLQEWWIARHLAGLDVAVAIGVGGSLDIVAGLVHRAPPVIQRLGMEWLYRLSHEPRRLCGRYLRRDIPYLARELSRSLCSRPGGRVPARYLRHTRAAGRLT